MKTITLFVSCIIFFSLQILLNSCGQEKCIGKGNVEEIDGVIIEETPNEYGPLISVTPDEFLKLPEDFQVIYVAGYIDAATFITYGYSFPDHNELVECFRSGSIGEFTKEVVEWLKNHPDYEGSIAYAIAETTGSLCKKAKKK